MTHADADIGGIRVSHKIIFLRSVHAFPCHMVLNDC